MCVCACVRNCYLNYLSFQTARSYTTIVGITVSAESRLSCTCEYCHLIDDFKKMFMQKFKEMEKAYTKQVKSIKQMKAHGKSKVNAVSRARTV